MLFQDPSDNTSYAVFPGGRDGWQVQMWWEQQKQWVAANRKDIIRYAKLTASFVVLGGTAAENLSADPMIKAGGKIARKVGQGIHLATQSADVHDNVNSALQTFREEGMSWDMVGDTFRSATQAVNIVAGATNLAGGVVDPYAGLVEKAAATAALAIGPSHQEQKAAHAKAVNNWTLRPNDPLLGWGQTPVQTPYDQDLSLSRSTTFQPPGVDTTTHRRPTYHRRDAGVAPLTSIREGFGTTTPFVSSGSGTSSDQHSPTDAAPQNSLTARYAREGQNPQWTSGTPDGRQPQRRPSARSEHRQRNTSQGPSR
ncbi:hypothetical protein ACJ6WF_22645 [Streptomyces sp. MMS24-I2-30]|uniref:hypothetical protein n=1 Tax=Streptomyces sp. MMS24-I2-30 TaxID=3351564 RepID=UPI003896899E